MNKRDDKKNQEPKRRGRPPGSKNKPKKRIKKPEKRKPGRPVHVKQDQISDNVKFLAGIGLTENDIAKVSGISTPTLLKYYREELDVGHVQVNANVAKSLYKKAISDKPQSVAAAIFWLKARAGWKEINRHEHTGKDGNPMQFMDLSKLTDEQLAELEKALTILAAAGIDFEADQGGTRETHH